MQHFLHSIADFFAPRPVQAYSERLSKHTVIEAVNDCGEKRYLEIPRPPAFERRENLEVLFAKCKRLLSFAKHKNCGDKTYYDIIELSDRVRNAMYTNTDILELFDEFEVFETQYKKNSKSQMDLSRA